MNAEWTQRRPETTAIVLGAAVASFFALLVWGGVLWRYLSPRTFQSGLLLGSPLSPDFIAFALRALFHAVVLIGVVAALARRAGPAGAARRLLFVGALGVVAIGLYHFVRVNLFPYTAAGRRGPDVIYNVVDTGVRFIEMAIPHMLLALAVARPGPDGRGPSAAAPIRAASLARAPQALEQRTPDPAEPLRYSAEGEHASLETRAIVLAAAVAALGSVAQFAVLALVATQPSAFQTIRVSWSDFTWITPTYLVIDAALAVGAGAALAGRHWARPVLLTAACLRLALFAYAFVFSWLSPPAGMPRYKGPELIISLTTDVARTLTTATVFALVVYVLLRQRTGAAARVAAL